jgi:transcriptional regulator with XRE-family HTH domain
LHRQSAQPHPVKVRRRALGLSQANLATLAGLKQPTISCIESGIRRRHLLETVEKLAAGLQTTPEKLGEEVRFWQQQTKGTPAA